MKHNDELLPQYDFSKGIRGKYFKRVSEQSKVYLVADSSVRSARSTKRGSKRPVKKVATRNGKPSAVRRTK